VAEFTAITGIGRKKNWTIGEGCATEIDYVYSGRRTLPFFDEFCCLILGTYRKDENWLFD